MKSQIIIVGSGPSGAMTAQTIVEAGLDVIMLDVGERDEKYQHLVPNQDFLTIRETDNYQHRYFLGDEYEAIPWDDIRVGAQLSPSRKVMLKNVDRFTPLISDTFFPMESLGYGGLGSGWGLGAYVYTDEELRKAGLDEVEMKSAYQTIADRIGISTGESDFRKFLVGDLLNTQPSLKMDNSIRKLAEVYEKKKTFFEGKNIKFGHPSMAIITKDLNNRKATSYFDMDFYSDLGKSAYRPWYTIDSLKGRKNFNYINKQLVLSFEEKDGYVKVISRNVESGQIQEFFCTKLILAASPLGTSRIVLRSFQKRNIRLPILCNPYAYMPCVHLRMLGTPLDRYKTSMAQAMMVYDKTGNNDDIVSISLFTYRSLMLI